MPATEALAARSQQLTFWMTLSSLLFYVRYVDVPSAVSLESRRIR
jgi:hypothetical protein